MSVKNPPSVFTPLGKGKLVYHLGNGMVLVEFEHGGGHIFQPEDVFNPNRPTETQTRINKPKWQDLLKDESLAL